MNAPAQTESSPYHVLLSPGETLDAMAAARQLATLLEEQHPLDLAQKLRYGGGWIVRDVGEELARQVAACVEAQGVSVRVVEGHLTTGETRPVRRLTFDGRVVRVDLPDGRHELPLESIGCVSLLALGDPESKSAADGSRSKSKDSLGRDVRVLGASSGYPFAEQRGAFLESGLQPLFFLLPGAAAGNEEHSGDAWRIERGTLFPNYAGIIGGLWIDNLLTFIEHLLPLLPSHRVAAGTARFWESAHLRYILIHKEEELANRLTWYTEVVGRGFLEKSHDPGRESQ